MASMDGEILHLLRKREKREKDKDLFLHGFNGWRDTSLVKKEREERERDLFLYSFNGQRDTPLLKPKREERERQRFILIRLQWMEENLNNWALRTRPNLTKDSVSIWALSILPCMARKVQR